MAVIIIDGREKAKKRIQFGEALGWRGIPIGETAQDKGEQDGKEAENRRTHLED